jgi:vesicle-fusing ATPase
LAWAVLKFAAIFGKNMKKKIRALFADARHDQETLGDGGKLHIIIFDELDSICKRRTRCNEYTRVDVQDNVTTQLLTEIDGITPLDNILVIETTNMVANIESAL